MESGSAPTDALQWAGALCLQSVLQLEAAPFISVVWLFGTNFGDKPGSEKETHRRRLPLVPLPSDILPKKFPDLQQEGNSHALRYQQDILAKVSILFMEFRASAAEKYTASSSEFLRSPHIVGSMGSESPLADPHHPTPRGQWARPSGAFCQLSVLATLLRSD